MKDCSLLESLLGRRSRRFGLGMEMPDGPLAYKSRHPPRPLTEADEAALTFAASGITGHALADLSYEQGGNIMSAMLGRTVASGDGIQTVSLIVTNDSETVLIKRPQDFPVAQLPDLIAQARAGQLTELYRASRIQIAEERTLPPMTPLFNLGVNQWSANAPGSTVFLPVNDLTLMYINGLLEIFNENTAAFILDERASFMPAGVGRFARSKGGHLEDNPAAQRIATVKHIELMVTEFVSIEQGMMLQNLGLMTQALGLGGFPHFANHEFGWFQALNFTMGNLPASRYLGANRLVQLLMGLTRKDTNVPYPLGLERNGETLLKPFCPPYYASMTDAVHAVVERKYGPNGIFGQSNGNPSWNHPETLKSTPAISQNAIDATIAYCEYLWKRYQRFPVHLAPFRTVLAYQATQLDLEFYDKFYKPEALTPRQRQRGEQNQDS